MTTTTPTKKSNVCDGVPRNSDRRQLLESAAFGGSIIGAVCWHKPIIKTVLLPAHAQTTTAIVVPEPVTLTTTATADTDAGLFVRAAASGGEARKDLEVNVEVEASRETAAFETVKELVLVTDEAGLAETTVKIAELDMLAGDRYRLKVSSTAEIATKVSIAKGKMLASRDFAIKSTAMEVSQSAITAQLSLSEAVRGTEWVKVDLNMKDAKGTTTATKSLSLAAKTDGKLAVASLNLAAKELAAEGIKIPEKGSVALSAKMARTEIFGSTALNVSKAVATTTTTRG